MDALILSLTNDQHKKYLSLVGKDDIILNFEIQEINFEAHSDENIKKAKNKIISSCETLLGFEKRDSFFSAPLTKEEIEKLIPTYFEAIRSISKAKQSLLNDIIDISRKIKEVETIHIEISKNYSDFLPYKAAFGKNEKYLNEIQAIDNDFDNEINKIVAQKESLVNELSRISTICDELIPLFFEKSSHAADTPKFKNFNDKEFFSTVSAFVEQVKNV